MSDDGEGNGREGNGGTATATGREGDGTLFAPGELVDHFRVMRLLELLRRVWQEVPVIWEGGLPVLRPPPKERRPSALRGDPVAEGEV